MNDAIDAILTNPKVTTVVVTASATQGWWLDWGVPILEAATKVGSFILIIIMIFLQYQKLIQTRSQNKSRKAKEDKANAAHEKTSTESENKNAQKEQE